MAKLSDSASNSLRDEDSSWENEIYPPKREHRRNFLIVGIGASAGGLSAIEQFLKGAPDDANIAYVIVQHLEPNRESILPELIARVTAMPVSMIEDRTVVEANHGIHMPIDHFLRSLAEDRSESAVGVIFSGTGSDGTQGLRSIMERAGLALAQEPSTAQFDGMPAI